MDKDRQLAKGTAHLLAGLEIDGVAVVTVSDGAVYAFSKRKLQELLEACERSGEDMIVIMVKSGPSASDMPEN